MEGTALRLLTVLLAIVALARVALATDVEAEARRIETRLMAPCCGATTLAQHHSPEADEMKEEIRSLLAQGWTEQRILDHFVERHGETIFSAPPARGFNLLAYLLPLLALVLGPLVIWRVLRRNRPPTERDAPLPRLSAEDRARLEQDLREV